MSILATLVWDPNPTAFTIPFIDHPVRWYGLFFAFGFFLCYLVLIRVIATYIQDSHTGIPSEIASTARGFSQVLVDRLAWYAVLGVLVGARLGHVIFYELDLYIAHPLDIFKVWEGGLASHGGTIGLLIGMYLYFRKVSPLLPRLSFLGFLDIFCIPVGLAGGMIRIGNFFNQEIYGTPTHLPWGVIFQHPFPSQGASLVPRHPVQLYEAAAYFALFAGLFFFWRLRRKTLRVGTFISLSFILIFTARFFLEYFKPVEVSGVTVTGLLEGQLLSIPFIFLGLILWASRPKKLLLPEMSPNKNWN